MTDLSRALRMVADWTSACDKAASRIQKSYAEIGSKIDFEIFKEDIIGVAENLLALAFQLCGIACERCGGTQYIAYADTSTWRGGAGGQAITVGICDECWGTGRKDRKGPNLRDIERRSSVPLEIMEIAKSMKGQDIRATAEPIYVVRQRRRIYGLDPECCDGKYVWLYDGEEYTEEEYQTSESNSDPGWYKAYYMDIMEHVQPFFSEKNAQFFIDRNRHRLTDPDIYVDSAYRNLEWIAIRSFLNSLVRD